MEINYRYLEPLHGILARHAAERGEHPRGVLRRMMPGTGATTFSVIMPRYLAALSATLQERLPVGGDFSPQSLAIRHTFFPVVETLLEVEERDDVLRRMIDGRHVAPYPICHISRADCKSRTMRWCPECARLDRESIIPDASWRLPHMFFGVRACYTHGCELISASCGFGDPSVLHNADEVMPGDLPAPISANPMDVTIARDLAQLFQADCPRPGRKRIATVLESAARGAGYVHGPAGQIAIAVMLEDFTKYYGREWLDDREVNRPTDTNAWPRNCMSAQAHVHTPFLIALVSRFFGIPLWDLLASAVDAIPARRFRKNVHGRRRFSSTFIASAKARFLEVRSAEPETSRSQLRSRYPYLWAALAQKEPIWLGEQFPGRRRKSKEVVQDWSERDQKLADLVQERATELRAAITRPNRITETVLRRKVSAMRWTSSVWRTKLPLFHDALGRYADTDASYGERRARWYDREISERRAPGNQGLHLFLRGAALLYLAEKEPAILAVAEELISQRNRNLPCDPPSGGQGDRGVVG